MKKVLKLAVFTVFLSSCGNTASEDAENARRALETQENEIIQDRRSRERIIEEVINQKQQRENGIEGNEN